MLRMLNANFTLNLACVASLAQLLIK